MTTSSKTPAKKSSSTPASAPEKKIDAINLDKAKINIKKIDATQLTKERITTEKNLYIGTENMTSDEKKKFRGKIRRDLGRFVNQILGKDRSEDERTKSIQEFLTFYKSHWKITDFKIDNFSQCKDETDLQDYKTLLSVVKSALED